jgi:hypothetical protein
MVIWYICLPHVRPIKTNGQKEGYLNEAKSDTYGLFMSISLLANRQSREVKESAKVATIGLDQEELGKRAAKVTNGLYFLFGDAEVRREGVQVATDLFISAARSYTKEQDYRGVIRVGAHFGDLSLFVGLPSKDMERIERIRELQDMVRYAQEELGIKKPEWLKP